MAKLLLKSEIKILAVLIIVANISLCYFFGNQWQTSKTIGKSVSQTTNFASTSLTSATLISSNDTNWSGYVVASNLQSPQATVTSVSASWAVPSVNISSSQDTFSAVWVGIGGFYDSTLIQTGTEQDSIQGQSQYSAWVEFLPQVALTIESITVSPGDQIEASILLINPNTDEWSISIKDVTTNQEYKNNFFYASSQLSAEWIVERPEISSRRSQGTLTTLADVGTVKLTNCQAMINGTTGTIGSFPSVKSIMYETVQPATNLGISQLTAVSDLSIDGSSFTVETSPLAVPESFHYAVLAMTILATTGVVIFRIQKRKGFV